MMKCIAPGSPSEDPRLDEPHEAGLEYRTRNMEPMNVEVIFNEQCSMLNVQVVKGERGHCSSVR